MACKRKFPRTAIDSEATLKGAKFWAVCRAGNISEGGLFLRPLPMEDIGAEVDLEFDIPNKELPVMARGVVIWRENDSEDAGGGVCFTRLYRIDRNLIQKYVLKSKE